ncbi:MAG: alpha/beta fold hydrolase [Halobacteriota archaeon]|uniref:alpha/beta fold hydrolase n=1 Tax=Natronomonas sp. TaxID=2184060 RepID=UPI003975BAF1
MTLGEDVENGHHDPIEGRYVWLEYDDETYRTFYEIAGDGDIPLLVLHTAGADSREYRHLLCDERLREQFTIYAFDMPWHGRSYPPLADRWWERDYQLTTDFYAGFIVHLARTLELEDPVVMGCSMGGEIILELASTYAEEVRAVIGLETTDFVPSDRGYIDDLQDILTHPKVDQEVFRPEWILGLQAPQSPEHNKRETWWIYSQAGHGVYAGDIDFYAREWDARERVEEIDTDECGVYLLTGEYDFSGRPEDTERVAERIDGATIEIMDGMGHFPPVENPEAFREYLYPIADEIVEK